MELEAVATPIKNENPFFASIHYVAALLAGGAAAVRGQSALAGFNPNANDTIRGVVV